MGILILLGAARPVIVIATIYTVNTMVVALITQFWKISVHTALFSSVATVSILVFGYGVWWLFLFLIPLAWSRIHRQRHTIWQAVAGALVAFVITAAVFWGFGYL